MGRESERPGAGAGPSELSGRDGSENNPEATPAQADGASPVLAEFDGAEPDTTVHDAKWRAVNLPLSDTGNADMAIEAGIRELLVYVPGRGFGVWHEGRFEFEGGTERALALVGGMLPKLWLDAAAAAGRGPISPIERTEAIARGVDPDRVDQVLAGEKKKRLAAWAVRCGNLSMQRNALDMLAPRLMVPLATLDADLSKLQVPNGTLDLEGYTSAAAIADPEKRLAAQRAALKPHDRSSRPSRIADAEFNPDADCPEFRRLIAMAMPDSAAVTYLQSLFGMTLGGQRDEVAIICLGRGGNGKSTLLKAMQAAVGSYAQTCPITMFCKQRHVPNGPTPEEAVLPGARIYVATEPETGVTLSSAKIKGLTGGDSRQANPKNKAVFTYRPVGVPIISANVMPNVDDPSTGFWRRVYPIHFEVDLTALPPAERRSSRDMERIIRAERSGILNWLLEGYALYRTQGLAMPPSVAALKATYHTLADPAGEFLTDRATPTIGGRVRTSELHKAFVAWCEEQGVKPMGNRAFSQRLALEFQKFKHKGYDYWHGVELVDSAAPPPSAAAAMYREDFE